MKKLYWLSAFLLLLISLQSCMVSQKPKLDFFDKSNYENKDVKYTSINVPMFLAKPIVKRALQEDGESEELINLIKKISDVKVMTVENGSAKMVSDYAKYLTKNNYEEWMSVKQQGNLISLNAKQTDDIIKRMIITVRDDNDETIFVDVKGKFSPDDISKIINATEKNKIKIHRN